jgi:hypothetical protein
LPPGYIAAAAPLAAIPIRVATARTIQRIKYTPRAVGAGTGTYTFTLRRAGAATPATITVAATSGGAAVALSTPLQLNEDDVIDMQEVPAGTITTSPTDVTICLG